jgi:hypothetical protein
LVILERLPFLQCVVFTNFSAAAESLVALLNDNGWPAVAIAGGQAQQHRSKAMRMLRGFKVRALVSTDLIARGVDVERVSLVINIVCARARRLAPRAPISGAHTDALSLSGGSGPAAGKPDVPSSRRAHGPIRHAWRGSEPADAGRRRG